jgi:hypothetical protein
MRINVPSMPDASYLPTYLPTYVYESAHDMEASFTMQSKRNANFQISYV